MTGGQGKDGRAGEVMELRGEGRMENGGPDDFIKETAI